MECYLLQGKTQKVFTKYLFRRFCDSSNFFYKAVTELEKLARVASGRRA